MNALLALIAKLAELGLITQDRADDLTTRLEAVEPLEDVEGVGTDDETAAVTALGNADPALISDVRSALVDAAQVDDASAATINDVADALDGLTFVTDTVEAIAEADQAERDAALARIAQPEAEPESDDDDGDPPAPDAPVAEDDPEAVEPELEPVMAAGVRPRAASINRRNAGQAAPTPEPQRGEDTWRLGFDANPGQRMGAELSFDEFIEAMTERLNGMSGHAFADEFVRLGTRVRDYPEDRQLGRDATENGRIVRERMEAVREECLAQTSPEAAVARVVTASGGVCAPAEPLYDYITVGDADRPMLNFYPSFMARRGGITWRTPATLASLGAVNTTASGVTNWSNTNDITPSDPATKVVFTATCPSPQAATVYAIVARLRHGNFMGLYDPETVAMWVHLQSVLQARIAETAILTTIAANSIQVQEADIDTGFARDWLNGIDRFVTAIRYRNRMPENEPLNFTAPTWAHAALRGDRVLEIPGASSDGFTMTNAEIDSWFAARGLRAGWFRDTQDFAAQAGSTSVSGTLAKYPTRVKAFISDIGNHTILDGGSLDMGVERSPTLNDTNDTQTMSEVMEAVASRGPIAYSLDMNVCVSGATSGTVSVPCQS